MTTGKITPAGFTDYEAIGELFIRDSTFLINLISAFTEDIIIEKHGDTMVKFSDGSREVYMILADESICDNILRNFEPKLEFKAEMDLTRRDLFKVVGDMKLLTTNVVTITHENGKVSFQVGKENEYDFAKHILVASGEDAKVSVGAIFMKAVDMLDNLVTLKIGTDIPIKMIDEQEHMTVSTIISPIVEN